jgi:hypothetical protein
VKLTAAQLVLTLMHEAVTLPHLHICPYEFYKDYFAVIRVLYYTGADISDRAVKGVGLRPFAACWYCGLEFRRRYGRLSLVSDVCCQVEVSASG